MESQLSFNSSENFRKKLLVRNLPPYRVDGSFNGDTTVGGSEIILVDYSIIDSTSLNIIGDIQEKLIYPINQYGPENQKDYGDMIQININRNYKSNDGEYDLSKTLKSGLELIGDNSELYHIVKNVYKPQTINNDFGQSVYYINNDKTILSVGSGEYSINDTLNSFLFQIGNEREILLKVLNKYKPPNGSEGDFGDTKYSINNLLVMPSNSIQVFGYDLSYANNSNLQFIGNEQEKLLIVKNKYTPENSNQYGDTRYSINNDLILGTNEGEYNYDDTEQNELENKGVSLRRTLFIKNEFQPEGGQSTEEKRPFDILKKLIISKGNYNFDDTIGSDLEQDGNEERTPLILNNQYNSENQNKQEVLININNQTKTNEGEYDYSDTVGNELEVSGQAREGFFYSLNKYGPKSKGNQTSGSYGDSVGINDNIILGTNEGEYDFSDTIGSQLESVGNQKETESYVKNKYVTGVGDYEVLTIEDLSISTTGSPYRNSDETFVFIPSTYSPVSILISENPSGSEGNLSQDSQLAALGAKQLQKEFKHRVSLELLQQTLGRVNLLDSSIDADTGELSVKPNLDPFDAIGLLTGNIPIIDRDYSITNPDLFLGQGLNFAARLAGTYSPYSYIPDEYFDYPNNRGNGPFKNPLSVIGGALGTLFSINQPKNQTSSELFLEFTTQATRSLLYRQLKYNPFKPNYKIGNNLSAPKGVFYIGDKKNSISEATSPIDQQPKNKDGSGSSFGPVLSYGNVGKLYEGEKLTGVLFGLNTRNLFSSGAKDSSNWANTNIVGSISWTAKDNYTGLGKLQGRGGIDFEDISEFNFGQISSFYGPTRSNNFEFTPGSILDTTQKLVDAGNRSPNQQEHVGNAINQVSKVFNDGYQELTKGSRVIRYTTKNSVAGGGEPKGLEYCRVFTKDRPFYTYDELQKTDGNIRKFSNSVLDNTFNLNIAPIKGDNSTNIQINNQGVVGVKKYMLSLENLAWRTSNKKGFTYEDLPECEKGPNGGRIMWFPPYDLSFDENMSASYNDNTFLGRTEPIYTYTNSTRKGNVSFKIIVDHPSILNVLVDKELENESSKEQITQVIDSFFAGCLKYDLYTLVKKFPMFTPNDVFEVQLLTTPEEIKIVTEELPNQIVEKEETIKNVPEEPIPTPAPCVEYQVVFGPVPSDLNYVDCSGINVTLTGGTGTTTTVCVSGTTTPTFTVVAVGNTVTSTNKPCVTTPTPSSTPEVTEQPLKDEFKEVSFYFHNDFPSKKTQTEPKISLQPYDQTLDHYRSLKQMYLTSGGNDGKKNFGAALNKIIQYNDPTKTDYTQLVLALDNPQQEKYLDEYIETRQENIEKFFNFIETEYTESENFIKKIGSILDEGRDVSFELLGSASAVSDVDYNQDLSSRRIESILQWMLSKKTPKGLTLKSYKDTSKLTIFETPTGEEGPLIEKEYSFINCSKSFEDDKSEGVVSINAMACRRVKIVKIFASDKITTTQNKQESSSIGTNNDGTTSALTQIPASTTTTEILPTNTQVESSEFITQTSNTANSQSVSPLTSNSISNGPGKVQNVVRPDLTKRLARKLLTECNYFELIKREDPMIYDGIKSKIKHFQPAFHSLTPEGLNSRLTFLQQCMRPGDTIPTVSADGNNTKLIYNDVTNSAFGAPPICVLRVGDFFHTKIVLDSLTFKYEDTKFDLNPEGIGVQPMIADVNLGFNFIGAHGLAGPVAQLQNALSFNYYANTEMYDERAESTEDATSKYDAELLDIIKNTMGVIEADDDRNLGVECGIPIGIPITTALDPNNLNFVYGTIGYKEIMKTLLENAKSVIQSTFQSLDQINQEFLLGGLQIFTKDRKYINGVLGQGGSDNLKIFGKVEKIQEKVENLIKKAKNDVDVELCPFIDGINNQNFSDKEIRKVKNQIKRMIDKKGDLLINMLETFSSQISNEELNLVKIVDKVNYISNKHDGYINNKGNVIVYDIFGTTEVTPPPTNSASDTFQEFIEDVNIIKNDIDEFYLKINNGIIIPSGDTEYNDNFTFSCLLGNNIITENENRFFMLFGKDITEDPIKFANSILDPINVSFTFDAFILTNLGYFMNFDNTTLQFTSGATPNGLYSYYESSKITVNKSFSDFKNNYYTNKFTTYAPFNSDKPRVMEYKIILSSSSPYDQDLKDLCQTTNSSGDKFNLKKSFT